MQRVKMKFKEIDFTMYTLRALGLVFFVALFFGCVGIIFGYSYLSYVSFAVITTLVASFVAILSIFFIFKLLFMEN